MHRNLDNIARNCIVANNTHSSDHSMPADWNLPAGQQLVHYHMKEAVQKEERMEGLQQVEDTLEGLGQEGDRLEEGAQQQSPWRRGLAVHRQAQSSLEADRKVVRHGPALHWQQALVNRLPLISCWRLHHHLPPLSSFQKHHRLSQPTLGLLGHLWQEQPLPLEASHPLATHLQADLAACYQHLCHSHPWHRSHLTPSPQNCFPLPTAPSFQPPSQVLARSSRPLKASQRGPLSSLSNQGPSTQAPS
mmetsp:Transcript_4923/g.17844  ORF Transcript_4923/g.17844 Transcript_4923/m.17844 type:complete len:247 (+) Transcript_4923:819-1559(+)